MYNTIHLLFLVSLLLAGPPLPAQHVLQEVARLQEVYKQQDDPEKQIDILNELSYAYRRISPDSVMKYANQAISLAESHEYPAGLAQGYKNKGIAFYKLGAPSKITISFYEKAMQFARQVDDHYTQAACLNNIALIQIYNLSYGDAIKNLLEAADIFDQYIEKENRLKALILGNLGTVYYAQQDMNHSILYFEKALAIAERIQDKSIPAMYAGDLAISKRETGRIQEAREDILKMLPLTDELGDMESKSNFLIRLAQIEYKLDELELAKTHANEALNIAQQHNFTRKIIQALSILSQSNAEAGQVDTALKRAKAALEISRQAEMYRYEAKTLLLLSDLHRQRRNYRQAYNFLQLYNAVHERNRDQDRQEIAARLEADYHARERQNQIDLLQQERLAQRNHIRLLWFTTTFFLLLLFVGGYVYFLKWRTSKALNAKNGELASAEKQLYEKNTQLQAYIESNMQLESFAHLASHDLREPMRTIVSFSQLLEKKAADKLDNNEREYLNFIQEGTRRIEKLINDLLAYAKINNSPSSIEQVDLNEILLQVKHDLQHLTREKNANIRILSPLPESMLTDPSHMYQLFQNLISNGIKYCREGIVPVIDICYRQDENYHCFTIADNGIGIAPEFFDRIFLLFKTLKNKSVSNSSGIGLATCKKIVERMGGRIWLESTENQGSTFYFTLPVAPGQNSYAQRKKIQESV